MPTRRTFLCSTAAATLVAGAPGITRAATPLTVVATTGMIADAARAVAGDVAGVTALMGPGVDPHAYRQTRSDIVALSRADLVLWNGLYLEAQLERLMADLAARGPVVAVAEAVPADQRLADEDYSDRFDPHVWMDPDLWAIVVGAVRDALIAARPDAEALFRANADTHLAEVAALGAYAREVLASVPEPARVLVTAHDAFGYFGRAYGWRVEGIQGISTESEAGLARISELVDLLVTSRIGAVFVESSVSDRGLRALIEGAVARGHTVTIGGELYSDAMGAPGTYEGTWLGMIDHNVTTIARALGGTAPAEGRIGRLGQA